MSMAHPSPRNWIARRETGEPVALPKPAPAPPAGPAPEPPPPPRSHRRPDPEGRPRRDPELLRRLEARWGGRTPFEAGALVLGIAIVVATVVCVAIEPMPDGAEPELRWWQDVLGFVVFDTLIAAVVALVNRARVGAPLAVAAGVAMIAATIECPTSHHHQVGWWVWGQAALSLVIFAWSLAFLGADRAAYRRTAGA